MSILSIFNALSASIFNDWKQGELLSNFGVNPNRTTIPQPPPRPERGFTPSPPIVPERGLTPQPMLPQGGGLTPAPLTPEQESFPQLTDEQIRQFSQPITSKGGEIEFEEPDKRYSIRKPKNIKGNSLFHETSPESINNLLATSDATGLNVSNDPDFALGQRGKGLLVELDKNKVFGDGGFARAIYKPSTEFVGENEFEIGAGTLSESKIKSITIKPGIKASPRFIRIIQRLKKGGWEVEKKEDGTTILRQPSTPTQGKGN